MKGPSPRFLFNASLIGLLIALQGGAVVAQIPNPVETAPAVVEPVSVPATGEETQATVGTTEEPVQEVPVPNETALEPVPQVEEIVATVEETATEIAATVNTVVGEIQETVEIVEQTTAPVEEAMATPELTAEAAVDPAEGGQATDPVQTQESTAQSEVVAAPIEHAASETVTVVEETAPIAAGPLDAVEVLGAAFQETVTAVEETAPIAAGPLDAVEVLGAAFQETVTAVEETAPIAAGPLDAVEVLGAAFQETVTAVEETAPIAAGPLDAVEVLGAAFQDTTITVEEAGQQIIAAVEGLEGEVKDVATTVEATAQDAVDSIDMIQVKIEEVISSAEQTVEQTTDQVEAIETLAGEIQETVTKLEETTQEIVDVLEVLEADIAEAVNAVQTTADSVVDAAVSAAGENQETVESVTQTARQVVDVVAVLEAQIETAVTTVEETAQIVEVLQSQVANTEGSVEASIQQIQALEGQVAQIESSLNPLEESAPQIIVAVEGLVERMEDSAQQVSDTGLRIELSAVAPEENAAIPAGPVDAVEVFGAGELALQRAALEEGLVRAESTNTVGAGGSLDSAIKDASGASLTNVPIVATDAAGRRSLLRAPFSAAGAKGPGSSAGRTLLNWTAILGVSQPSLAILVDAVNDADGDGIYSDSEIAAVPGAEVSFKGLITNIGAVNFEIATVTHGYNGGSGAAQGAVCGELVGIMLAPGESLACSFPVPGYAPAKGGTLVSTITAAGFEVGKGAKRGASDSDTSQVDTLLAGDEVLAVAIKRNLAFTGTDAARLLALGLLLLGAGGAFLALARLRTRPPVRPLPSESPIDVLSWWAAGPLRTDTSSKLRRWKARSR